MEEIDLENVESGEISTISHKKNDYGWVFVKFNTIFCVLFNKINRSFGNKFEIDDYFKNIDYKFIFKCTSGKGQILKCKTHNEMCKCYYKWVKGYIFNIIKYILS